MAHGAYGGWARSSWRRLLWASWTFTTLCSTWEGAAAWLDGRTTRACRWFGWARHRLRHGQLDGVLADLVEALAVESLPDSARDTLTALYAYLERHRDHIDYAKYKDLGLPMGSGMVESACKWLIQRFMERECAGVRTDLTICYTSDSPGATASFEALFQVQLQPSPNIVTAVKAS